MVQLFVTLCITSICPSLLHGYIVNHTITNKQDAVMIATVTVSLEPDELLYADGVRFDTNNPATTISWHAHNKEKTVYDPVSKRSLLAWQQHVSFTVSAHASESALPVPLQLWCTILTSQKSSCPLVTIDLLKQEMPAAHAKTTPARRFADAIGALKQPRMHKYKHMAPANHRDKLLHWTSYTTALSTLFLCLCMLTLGAIILLRWQRGWLYLTASTLLLFGSWMTTHVALSFAHLPLTLSTCIAGMLLSASRFHSFDRTLGMACITSAVAIGLYYAHLFWYR